MQNSMSIASALATVVGLSIASSAWAQSGPAAVPGYENEKCYGVVKAGKNDCQTATHSCAGTSTMDADPASWLYVPAGTCEKVTGGALEPKA